MQENKADHFLQKRMSFKEAVITCIQKYATFKGRASRAEYWWFALFNALISTVIHCIALELKGPEAADTAMMLTQLVFLIPALAAGCRRLHDINFSGWWQLLALTIIGMIPIWILLCFRSQPEPNRYGDIPCLVKNDSVL